jgi:hypothetical protein
VPVKPPIHVQVSTSAGECNRPELKSYRKKNIACLPTNIWVY